MPEGGCLCGAVRFAIDGRLSPIQACHARRCQRATGAAFAPELACRLERFRWLRGEDEIQTWEAPLLREPPPYRRAFCRHCGSPLPVPRPEAGFVVLLAGSLDEPPEVPLFRHIFLDHRPAWHRVDDDLPKFPQRPPPDQRLPQRREDG